MNEETVTEKPIYDSQSATLEEWLEIVLCAEDERTVLVEDSHFPTGNHAEEYIRDVHSRSEAEVKALIRKFAVPAGSLGHDELIVEQYLAQPERFKEAVQKCEFTKRLIRGPVWEGLTWILDLLPDYPQEAIRVVNAYFWRTCSGSPTDE